MCFTGEMSGSFSMVGLFMAFWIWKNTGNLQLAIGVFYFFLMEFLQYFQYWFIDDCDNEWNKWLTLAGFAHICYQPYFTHLINSAMTRDPKVLQMWIVILRICLVGGSMLLWRHFQTYIWAPDTHFPTIDQVDNVTGASQTDLPTSTEWLRGEELCTVSGKYHLAWVVPMADVSYYTPSAAIHSFMMFVPFFVTRMEIVMVLQGAILWAAGPFLAAWFTENLMEQASIWCFFSIAQIGAMLLLVRGRLLKLKADGEQKDARPVTRIDFGILGWPMAVKGDLNAKKK
jgi:hypothetical protein